LQRNEQFLLIVDIGQISPEHRDFLSCLSSAAVEDGPFAQGGVERECSFPSVVLSKQVTHQIFANVLAQHVAKFVLGWRLYFSVQPVEIGLVGRDDLLGY